MIFRKLASFIGRLLRPGSTAGQQPSFWNPVQPRPESLAALDPYLEWALKTNFAYYIRGGRVVWFPILIELRGVTAAKFAAGDWGKLRAPTGWQDWLWIPPLYAHPPAGLERATFCTANVRLPFFEELAKDGSGLRAAVKRVSLSRYTPSKAPEPYNAPVFRKKMPAAHHKVVTAVIDDGLAFANDRFRRGNQTRIEYLWNQDGPMSSVPGVLYGREIARRGVQGIDALMVTARHGGALVAEEEVYEAARFVDYNVPGHKPVVQRGAHGSHVMDLACNSPAAAVDCPVIGVQLPVAVTWDSSGALLASPVLDGLTYIMARADQLAIDENCGPLPIVVNLSYAYIAGPHDGDSMLEAAIDQVITLRRSVAPMSVVLPAGNSYLARCHAQFTLAANAEQQPPLRWRIQPDDETPSFIELWMPPLAVGRAQVAVRITTPTGDTGPWIQLGQVYEWRPQVDLLCLVTYFDNIAAGGSRDMISIMVAATATLDSAAEVAPAGRWTIEVRNDGPAATFDAWIQRDDTPYGYPNRGRQSRFDDQNYNYCDDAGRKIEADNAASYVSRAGTLNAMATGRETIVVGGFHRKEWTLCSYTASGPIISAPGTVPHRNGPDVTTVSEDSAVLNNLLATGTPSNSTVAMNGTSVAAPQITRWIAGDMAAGTAGAGTRARVQAIVSNRPPTMLVPPPERWGVTQIAFPAMVPRRTPFEP